jgi:hypothetical protein
MQWKIIHYNVFVGRVMSLGTFDFDFILNHFGDQDESHDTFPFLHLQP